MPWRILLYFLLTELYLPCNSVAQFYDATEWLNIQQGGTEGMYGNGISLHDFNRDGLDDITICTNGNGVRTYINQGDHFEELNLFNSILGDIKQPIWIDFDNDFDADFFCTVFGGGCFLFQNIGDLHFTDVTSSLNLPSADAKCFGAAWADYDRDGDLDVYVANYDFFQPGATSNWFFVNQGDGSFTESAGALGIDNGYRASFQPAWCDVNLDGWPDLFVINDKYHGNALYLNNAGVFSDVSESFNMSHAMEAMSNSWCDYDHDGDFDVYVSNSVQGNKLLRNDGTYFTDIAPESQTTINSVCWNALWFDVDHDLNTEIHVATNSPVFSNNQNRLFEYAEVGPWSELSIPADQRSVLSEAKGDINNDGYWDMVQVAELPVNTACWMNTSGSNHYLKFTLVGTAGNTDGVGALIKAVTSNEEYFKTIFAGAGFLSQDSRYEIFSLKSDTSVDTLTVQWPSGWVDVYTGLAADSSYTFTEGETYRMLLSAQQNAICPGDSTMIFASAAGSVLWQNNSDEFAISVNAPGWYVCSATHALGFTFTDSIYIHQWNDPEFEFLIDEPLCYDEAGASVEVITDAAAMLLVNDEASDFVIDSLPSGNYHAVIIDANACRSEFEFTISIPEPLMVMFMSDTACYGEPVQINPFITGGEPPYEILWNNIDPENVYAGSYEVTAIDATGCSDLFLFEVMQYDSLSAAIDYDQDSGTLIANCSDGISPYQFHWMNGATTAQISAGDESFYSCQITDAAGCVAEVSFTLAPVYLNNTSQLSFYPIPAKDVLHIVSALGGHCVLTDAHGAFITNVDIHPGKNELYIGNLRSGCYFLRSADFTRMFVVAN